jgi:hypothetical protein
MRKEKRNIKLIKSLKKYTSLIVTLLIMALVFYPFVKDVGQDEAHQEWYKKDY